MKRLTILQSSHPFPFLFLFLFLFLFPFLTFAQERPLTVPDYKAINKEVNNPASPYYYAPLLKRYESADTTLSRQDFFYLYFGFSQQSGYSGYKTPNQADSIGDILKKKALTEEDKTELNRLCKAAAKELPFNLRYLSYLAYSYRLLKDTLNANQVNWKINGVADAIISTGDGKTEQTAFYVISVSDEYELLDIFHFEFAGQQSLTKSNCDKLTLKTNRYELEALYFNVSVILDSLQKLFDK